MKYNKNGIPKKDHQLTIRMSESMYEVLTKQAKEARMPRTQYIRMLILNHRPVLRPEIVYNDPKLLKALRNMGWIGNNLNQIARYLNEGGKPTASMYEDLVHCISELMKMREEIHEMAGEYRGNH